MKLCLTGFVCTSALFLSASAYASAAPAKDQPTLSNESRNLVYVVKPGDTLIDLAQAYLTTPSDYRIVQQLNRVREPRHLRIGQPLSLPVHLLRTEPARAQVNTFRGQVTLDHGSGPRAPEPHQAVSEGVVISTAANASLRLSLSDGGHIVVPSNSRVRLTRLRRFLINGAVDHALEVQRGRLESRVAPRQFPGGYRVTTPVSVSAVRGTDFRVSLNNTADRAATEVLEGRVEVEWGTDNPVVEASTHQAISVSALGMVHTDLPPAPSLTNPDAILTQPQVVLKLAPQPGTSGYRGRLALDAGLVETIAEVETEAGSTDLSFGSLDDGLYYVRVTAIDHDGIEGLGNVYNLVRVSNQVGQFGAQGLGDPRRRAYRFRWEPGGTTQAAEEGDFYYRFVLHRQDEAGQNLDPPVLDRVGLEQPNVSLLGLNKGIYSWRVQLSQTRFGRTVETWSEPQILRIGQ